jgi:hypothetical protein
MEGRANPDSVVETGYQVANHVDFDGALRKPKRGKQFVLVLSTFRPECEAEF